MRAHRIAAELDSTWTAFQAQCRRRDALVKTIQDRIGAEPLEFVQIRAATDGLYESNQNILGLLEQHPPLRDEVPGLTPLKRHIVFWLNKYERVFKVTKEMCVLYTGVEDGVPFPKGVDRQVAASRLSS